MPLEPFSTSRALTLGVELELQLVGTHDFDLVAAAPDLLRVLEQQGFVGDVKPEITSSMIEIATGICTGYTDVLEQLTALRDGLLEGARRLDIGICGGGAHPFQLWGERQISDSARYQHLSDLYGYLAKQFTVFGQHVHIGCPGPDEALLLLHGMSRFIPHLIALSASSPFVQGHDTGFDSARLNSIFAFPLSGRAPFVLNWSDFEGYFAKMARTGVVESMKDFYWDIRPKPEYGTIEVRVLDTPLCVERAARLAALIQTIARWLMVDKPFVPAEDDYLVYAFNRFQACRFGYEGVWVDPESGERRVLGDAIVALVNRIGPHAAVLGTQVACAALANDAATRTNDAMWLREHYSADPLLPELVRRQCLRWAE
ncbi:YbdK family carboxylate-amine ligase [Zoogloea sp. LCSB751]|uniref:YbdK family carboxylate-amine ligase n=1 Tax=Zoogloea sp. LCSB751 TaxID=1965277 RepID=UPI0009A4C016|nr:YbdK family carboxylate-amine ligase [Zoogloea sp. LCSB751]